MTDVIGLQNVSRIYGEGPSAVHAVRDLTVHIEAGTFVTIVGASGSGKSTLLNVMGALDQPNSGQVTIDGKEVYSLSDNARTVLRRDRIGFVFQFFHLLPTLNAVENVSLPAKLAGKPRRDLMKRAEELLDGVGLSSRIKHRPDQLSGGEMQRVAIARALMMDPPIILADEPTGNLDSTAGQNVLTLLRQATADGRTVILVTHDANIAAQGDRVLTMADGHLQSDKVGPRNPDSIRPKTGSIRPEGD